MEEKDQAYMEQELEQEQEAAEAQAPVEEPDEATAPPMEPTERERLKANRVKITRDTLFARRFRYQSIGMIAVILALAATVLLLPASIGIQVELSTWSARSYVPTLYYALVMLGVGIFVYVRSFTMDRLAYIKYSSSIPLLLLLHLVICSWNLG